jgi:hypothetical protein
MEQRTHCDADRTLGPFRKTEINVPRDKVQGITRRISAMLATADCLAGDRQNGEQRQKDMIESTRRTTEAAESRGFDLDHTTTVRGAALSVCPFLSLSDSSLGALARLV